MLDMLFSDHAAWFGVPAVVGTVFFALRLVLMLVGGDFGHHDFDAGSTDLHHGDPGEAFKVLSIQSIAAFVMGFGWGGLAGLRGSDWSWAASTLFAIGCGLGMMWLLAMLLRGMVALQSSGNVSPGDAVGSEADVYVNIPSQGAGRGQVRVVISKHDRIYDAVTEGEALPSHTRVRITRVNEDNTVTVTPVGG